MAGYPSEALTGPAHALTGAGEAMVPDGPRAVPEGAWAQERDRKASTESVAGIVDKLLPIIAKTFATTARKDTALETAWRAVVVEAVKKEAESAVQAVPFGKVLLLTLRLSASFADGVGAGMAAYYEKETRGRQQARDLSTDSLDADLAEVQFETQYLARAANGLSAVLTKGLVEAGVKALSLLLDAAGDTLQQNVTAVARQVAKEVPKRYPVAAAFHVMVAREAKPIPEARARIERIAFSTLAESALSIFVSKRSSALLAPVFREVGGKEPVDVALLAALIRVLAQGSGETYAKYVPLGDLRQMILDGARELLERVIESGVKVTEGDATAVSVKEIVIPGEILAELKGATIQCRRQISFVGR